MGEPDKWRYRDGRRYWSFRDDWEEHRAQQQHAYARGENWMAWARRALREAREREQGMKCMTESETKVFIALFTAPEPVTIEELSRVTGVSVRSVMRGPNKGLVKRVRRVPGRADYWGLSERGKIIASWVAGSRESEAAE